MATVTDPTAQQAASESQGVSVGSVVQAWQTNAASAGTSAWQSIGTSYTFLAWFLTASALLVLSDFQPALAGKLAMLVFIAVLIRVVAEGKF